MKVAIGVNTGILEIFPLLKIRYPDLIIPNQDTIKSSKLLAFNSVKDFRSLYEKGSKKSVGIVFDDIRPLSDIQNIFIVDNDLSQLVEIIDSRVSNPPFYKKHNIIEELLESYHSDEVSEKFYNFYYYGPDKTHRENVRKVVAQWLGGKIKSPSCKAKLDALTFNDIGKFYAKELFKILKANEANLKATFKKIQKGTVCDPLLSFLV